MNPHALDYGLVSFALILIYKMLEIGKQLFLAKKINGVGAADSRIPTMTPLACQVDPVHFSRIKDMDATCKKIDSAFDRGEMGCAWTGRDEVRDMLESIRELTGEIKALRTEMQNGRNK